MHRKNNFRQLILKINYASCFKIIILTIDYQALIQRIKGL